MCAFSICAYKNRSLILTFGVLPLLAGVVVSRIWPTVRLLSLVRGR